MHFAARIVSFISRRTEWAEGHVFAYAPEQFAASDGIRTALAVAIVLAAEIYFDHPHLAFGAIAAFWTSLCDPLGSDRRRFRVMTTFALMGSLVISLAAYGAHWGLWATGVTLFLLTFLCLLTRTFSPSFGPVPAQGGFIAAIAVIVGLASPRGMPGALEIGACFLGGSSLMILLAMFPRRGGESSTARLAVVAIFSRLDEMLRILMDLDAQPRHDDDRWSKFDTVHRRAIRFSIERAREAVARSAADTLDHTHLIDAASRVFSGLVVLGHNRRSSNVPFDAEVERPTLQTLRDALHRIVMQTERGSRDGQAILAAAASIPEIAGNNAFAKAISFVQAAIKVLGERWGERAPALPATSAPVLSLKVSPSVAWHSLRTSLAVLISHFAGVWFGSTLPYWGAIATIVVMQPLAGNTWLRALERAGGGILGGLIAVIALASASSHIQMASIIVPLCAAVIALRLVNYGIFVVFLTPMFILMTDYVHATGDLIWERILNEARGACIGIAAGILLWPTRERQNVAESITTAIAANMAFASAVVQTPAPSEHLDELERNSGLASSRLETAYERLWLEGKGRSANLALIRPMLIALRAVCGAAAATELTRAREPEAQDQAKGERYQSISDALQSRVRTSGPATLTRQPYSQDDDLEHWVQALIGTVDNYCDRTSASGRTHMRFGF